MKSLVLRERAIQELPERSLGTLPSWWMPASRPYTVPSPAQVCHMTSAQTRPGDRQFPGGMPFFFFKLSSNPCQVTWPNPYL